MPEDGNHKFGKEERLCSRKAIDRLFNGGGSRSMAAFPLRLVYLKDDDTGGEAGSKLLISVPKRCFKRAVKRNCVKRQIREAYRKNKPRLAESYLLALIWLDDKLWPTVDVEAKVVSLLQRLTEKTERK